MALYYIYGEEGLVLYRENQEVFNEMEHYIIQRGYTINQVLYYFSDQIEQIYSCHLFYSPQKSFFNYCEVYQRLDGRDSETQVVLSKAWYLFRQFPLSLNTNLHIQGNLKEGFHLSEEFVLNYPVRFRE